MLHTKISYFYGLFREVFFGYHREHESEIHVDLKRLIYHQTTKSS